MRMITPKLFILLIITLLIFSCKSKNGSTSIPGSVVNNPNSASGHANSGDMPVITFEKDFHDFGKLISGEKVTYAFKFTNTGKSLLIISNVSTSCGCTVSDFPKEPIKPGASASIDISFDSKGKHGLQNKTITVFTNAQPPTTTLRIQSSVVEPDE